MSPSPPSSSRTRRLPGLLARLAPLVIGWIAVPFAAAQGEPPPDLAESAAERGPKFRVRGEIRLRYEGIEGQYRADRRVASSDHLDFSRVLLGAELELDPVTLGAEIIDGRQFFGGSSSQLDTGNVDTLDLLQGYVDWRDEDRKHRVRVGRQTMRLGSERLSARQLYRNTINAFTGVHYRYEVPNEESGWQAFWLMPVQRKPTEIDLLVDGRIEFDRESIDRQFFGGFWQAEIDSDTRLEVYALGLVEQDDLRRRLATPGVRVVRRPAIENFDFEGELIGQVGRSRATLGGPELDHAAWLVHASVGYTIDAGWRPRIRAAFDVASGDSNPGDSSNQRFDGLFGAQRFDFGPTGIYGAIARANLVSPEVRVEIRPTDNLDGFLAARSLWVQSATDAVPRGGVRDPSGATGREIGQQLESRLRWWVIPETLLLEVGGAYLFAGSLLRSAPNARGEDVAYGYFQTRFSF